MASESMRVYQVTHQPRPRAQRRTSLVTDSKTDAWDNAQWKRKAEVVTWENGQVLKVEQVPVLGVEPIALSREQRRMIRRIVKNRKLVKRT